MLSRHLAAPILGLFLIAPLGSATAQEKRSETKPAPDAKPSPEKASGSHNSDLAQILRLMNGGVIILVDGDEKPTEKKPANAAAAVQKALKQLSGPADQLDLREVAKLLNEALSEMKQKSGGDFRVNVGGVRIAVPPLGANPGVPNNPAAAAWGGPGSAPWMPGTPMPRPGARVAPEDMRATSAPISKSWRSWPRS